MGMISKFVHWWRSRTLNERLMYSLIVLLAIGIATRWRFIFAEVADAFSAIFK